MNATYALVALGLGSFLLGMVLGSRARTVGTHPVGTAPQPPPPGADRLTYWRARMLELEQRDRLVAICELHRDGEVDTDTAIALIDEVV